MRERNYTKYRKEKSIALAILGVLLIATLAFALVFSLTAKNDGNPLSSLTPEIAENLNLSTGNSVMSGGSSVSLDYAANNTGTLPAGTVMEVGSVPSSGYTASGNQLTATNYNTDFHNAAAGTVVSTNYYLDGNIDLSAANIGSAVMYSGTLDGNGKKVTLNYSSSASSPTVFTFDSSNSWNSDYQTTDFKTAGVFGAVLGTTNDCSNGVIKNLTIVIKGHVKIQVTDDTRGAAFGFVTGWVRGKVENVKIELASDSSVTFVNNNAYTDSSGRTKRGDTAFGLFAGISGNDSDNYKGKFYNVESVINGSLIVTGETGVDGHIGMGGFVGAATNIDMNGARLAGGGKIILNGSGGWRFVGGFVGMGRGGFGYGIKASTTARLKMQNLVLDFEGTWGAATTGKENYVSAVIGNTGVAVNSGGGVRLYTSYTDSTSFGNSTGNNTAGFGTITTTNNVVSLTNGRLTTALCFTTNTGSQNAKMINIRSGNQAELKLLHTLGAETSTVIAVPNDAVDFAVKGAEGVEGATYNFGGKYLDLANAPAGTSTITWLDTIQNIKVNVPNYTEGWLTDFGKVPYGYNVPGDATPIADKNALTAWLGSTSNYGYLTSDIAFTSQDKLAETLPEGKILDGAGHTVTLYSKNTANNWNSYSASVSGSYYGKTAGVYGGLFTKNYGTLKNVTVKLGTGKTFCDNKQVAGADASLITGFAVAINYGRVENVRTYIPSGANWQFHTSANTGGMYNVMGGVVGVNEGYVGYASVTNEGKVVANTGEKSSGTDLTALGGVIGVNLGKAEYLTSYGNGETDNAGSEPASGFTIRSQQGKNYLGSLIGISASSGDSAFQAFAPGDNKTASLDYAYAGYTGRLRSINKSAVGGSAVGYLGGSAKGIVAYTSTTGSTPAIKNNNELTQSNKGTAEGGLAQDTSMLGAGSPVTPTGGYVCWSSGLFSTTGRLHGYFDYFYNDGTLHLEIENAADTGSLGISNRVDGDGTNYSDELKEFTISKAGLDKSGYNKTLTTGKWDAASKPTTNYTGLSGKTSSLDAIALAGLAKESDMDYSPTYQGTPGTTHSAPSSLPLTGSTSFAFTRDVSLDAGSSNTISKYGVDSGTVTIDGQGHTLTINLGSKQVSHADLGFSSYGGTAAYGGVLATWMKNVTIKNLNITFSGSYTFRTGTSGYRAYFGLIAGYAENVKLINCKIQFPNSTIKMQAPTGPAGSADVFFGGLFGLFAGGSKIEKCLIRGGGSNAVFQINETYGGKWTHMGLLAGRISTTSTSDGYQDLIINGVQKLQIDSGDNKVANIFGSATGEMKNADRTNFTKYLRSNIYFFNSTITFSGDRNSLFAEIHTINNDQNNNGGTGNNSSYISIYFVGTNTTADTMKKCHYNAYGMPGNGSEHVINVNGIQSGAGSSSKITSVSPPSGVGTIDYWRAGGITAAKSTLTNYNNAVANLANISATVNVNGTNVGADSLPLYISKAKKLYDESGYKYKLFVRYAPKSNEENSRYYNSQTNLNSNVEFVIAWKLYRGKGVNMGTITLKSNITVYGYATHAFGEYAESGDVKYNTVYAKFNKLQDAYNGASGADKAFFKEQLERSVSTADGVGIMDFGEKLAGSFTEASNETSGDPSLQTGSHFLDNRVGIAAATDVNNYYIFLANNTLTYYVKVIPTTVTIIGLITEYKYGDNASFVGTSTSATLTRKVSDGGVTAEQSNPNYEGVLDRGEAVLVGISKGKFVYFGQTSDGLAISITTSNNALYDTFATAKAAVPTNPDSYSDANFRNGTFTISGLGSAEVIDGKSYVDFPNSGYMIDLSNTGKVSLSDGVLSVGGNGVAIFKYQTELNELRFSGKVSDNTQASGERSFWTGLNVSQATVSGSYVPGKSSEGYLKTLFLQIMPATAPDFAAWRALPNNVTRPTPGGEIGYNLRSFGLDDDNRSLGTYYYLKDGNNLNDKEVKVSIGKITIKADYLSRNCPINVPSGGDTKVYDNYATDQFKGVASFASDKSIWFNVGTGANQLNINSSHNDALWNEVIGSNNANRLVSYEYKLKLKEGDNMHGLDEALDVGTYTYWGVIELRKTSNTSVGYIIEDSMNEDISWDSGNTLTVKPLPVSFDYNISGNLSATYTGAKIGFATANVRLSDAAKNVIKAQYSDTAKGEAAASAAENAVNAITSDQVGVRYVYAADENGVNTMFNHSSRFGATYANSGAINAGQYLFSGYVKNQNFVGLTNDYKEVIEATGQTFNRNYFSTMASNLWAFGGNDATRKEWGIDLSTENDYGYAFSYSGYSKSSSALTNALCGYYDLLDSYKAYPDLYESSAKDTRTVVISRAVVSVYVKDTAIEYGSVQSLSESGGLDGKGPQVSEADFVITSSNIGDDISVVIRIKPEAFNIDGTVYQHLPVKLADPNNPNSSLTSYRNALYVDSDVDTGNPNFIVTAVDGNLTVVRKELTVSWEYDVTDPTYNSQSGVYSYASGVKHTMIPRFDAGQILNGNLLDFDITGDGDMETVGVHKIVLSFSNRYALDSYNYYLGNSATGYMVIKPMPVTVTYRYYSDNNYNSEYDFSRGTTRYKTSSSWTPNAAITVTVNNVNYISTDGTNWKAGDSRLDLAVYPANEWISKIKNNLRIAAPSGKVSFNNGWSTSSSSTGTITFNAPGAGSSYVATVEMDGFVSGNFALDMHELTFLQIYQNGSYAEHNNLNGTSNANDPIKQNSTSQTVSMSTTAANVLPYNSKYLNGGAVIDAGTSSAVYTFSQASDYTNLGYVFDAGERNVAYKGLFYASGNDANLRNSSTDSRYTGFQSMIYSLSASGRGWERYVWSDGNIILLYFNVNLTDALTAAISKNGGINVSVGGVAISAGHYVYNWGETHDFYHAGPMSAGIALNSFGNNSMVGLNRTQTTPTAYSSYPSLSSLIYNSNGVLSTYRENLLYDGSTYGGYGYYFHPDATVANDVNKQGGYIYANNVRVPSGNDPDNSLTTSSKDLERRTLISSADSNGGMKGDSFRVNLYAVAVRDGAKTNYDWGRGVMAQFGKLQVSLSRADNTAPTVSAPKKYGNAYEFTVNDSVGVDISSIQVNLKNNKTLTVANGGLIAVSKRLSNGLVTEVTFRTATTGDLSAAAGVDNVNQIFSITARDITYGGGSNSATYGFNSTGLWGHVGVDGHVLKSDTTDIGFVDTVAPQINFIRVGLENYASADSPDWEKFVADSYEDQIRAKKFITATWRQQNYLWLKFSAGTGKIPSAEVTSDEFGLFTDSGHTLNSETHWKVINKYSAYTGTVVTKAGIVLKALRITHKGSTKTILYRPDMNSYGLIANNIANGSANLGSGGGYAYTANADGISVGPSDDRRAVAFPRVGLTRVAVYDRGDLSGTPIFEQFIGESNRDSVYVLPNAIRLEANTRYYFVAEDQFGNRSERTLFFNMVDTADASSLSIVANPEELDDNKLKPYTGSNVFVNGGNINNWAPIIAEQLFNNLDNPRFALDTDNDGVYDYRVMLVNFENSTEKRVAVRSTLDGKITYICGNRDFVGTFTANANSDKVIERWLAEIEMHSIVIESNYSKVTLMKDSTTKIAESVPMVVDDENLNEYIEDTWSNTSVIMRLTGSGESNSLARFYYRYAPDPTNPDLPNTAIDENVTSNPHLFRNYGWMALPVVIDKNGNVIVDEEQSLIFERTGIYRLEIKIELAAGQCAYLIYKDSFQNRVYNAFAEGGNIRAYKVDSAHYTSYSGSKPGAAEFGNTTTEIGYYTVKIDKRVYFLDLETYWYSEENKVLSKQEENIDPNLGNTPVENRFANIAISKWNSVDENYTNRLEPQASGNYSGAYKVGSSSASNRNSWIRMDIQSKINDNGMWYAVYKILADVYIGDKLVKSGVDLPLGSETNRYEVGRDGIAMRRIRDMAINMPDIDTSSLDNIKLVYRFYFKYYYSFVIDYDASYASYYGSAPKQQFTTTKITPISGKLQDGYSFGSDGIKLTPIELTGSNGNVNFNYSSIAIQEYDDHGVFHTGGFTVTYVNERGISTTENITNSITLTIGGEKHIVPIYVAYPHTTGGVSHEANILKDDNSLSSLAKGVTIGENRYWFLVEASGSTYTLQYAYWNGTSYVKGTDVTISESSNATISADNNSGLNGATAKLNINLKAISDTTPAGKHFYAISEASISDSSGATSGDYILKFQRAVVRQAGEENADKVAASMTSSQIQFANGGNKYTFRGLALVETESATVGDDRKVNSVIVNGTEYFVKIDYNDTTKTLAKLYSDDGLTKEVGSMSINDINHFTLRDEKGVETTYESRHLMIYDGEGREVGEFGRTFTIGGTTYVRGENNPYYTVEKAFVNVSRGGNFVKLYDGTYSFLGGNATDGWNANEYAFYDAQNSSWIAGNKIGEVPRTATQLTPVEMGGYYVGSDGIYQANVSRETDITYLKLFLPYYSNYQFGTASTKHTVVGGKLVKDGSLLGDDGPQHLLAAGFKTVDSGEIIGKDSPIVSGVHVATPINWSSIMLPDTSYAHAEPNRIDATLLSTPTNIMHNAPNQSITTITARPIAAKSQVKNNDTVTATFNGAPQGGSVLKIIEDVSTITPTYGSLPAETVVFTISDSSAAGLPILAGTYDFRFKLDGGEGFGKITIGSVETAFGAANLDSIPENYYLADTSGSSEAMNLSLEIERLENSFALNRVVKADGSGYELRVTITNLKPSQQTQQEEQSYEGLDFLNAAVDDKGNRYLTDTEFGKIKKMIAKGEWFTEGEALSYPANREKADEYYALLEKGTELKLSETDTSKLTDDEKRLIALKAELEQILEYRFQCALGKIFKSANNGSDTFYTNMPDYREGRFADLKFNAGIGTFTMVYKGNVNLDTVYFSDRYSMRVSGIADFAKNTVANAVYSTNSWTSDSSLADGQIETGDYVGKNKANITYISTQEELKNWLLMTDTAAAGYGNAVLTDNIFGFTWGYAAGYGGAIVGLDSGRTLNGNGYIIGFTGAEFNMAGNLNMRLVTKETTSGSVRVNNTNNDRWSVGGVFLQYIDGIIKNTNFVYRATRKYDISDINREKDTNNAYKTGYGLAVGIISGFTGSGARFSNVSLDIKGQFHVNYVGTGSQLKASGFIGVGGFTGYAHNMATFADCSVNYYYVPEKVLGNDYTPSTKYEISVAIDSSDTSGYHLTWGGFAGITAAGAAERLSVATETDAEFANGNNVPSIFVGRSGGKTAWMNAAGMFGLANRASTAATVTGIINKFRGRVYTYSSGSSEFNAGSLAGDANANTFKQVYAYGANVANAKGQGTSGNFNGTLSMIGSNKATSNIHTDALSIYENDKGYVDYYFGGNRYDYYKTADGEKMFYETTKFINGSSVAYSPFDDYVKVGTTAESKGWTGWKLVKANADGSYNLYIDYKRTTVVGSIRFTNSEKTAGSFTLETNTDGGTETATYNFTSAGVTNAAGDAVVGMVVDSKMMTVSDQNNTYYFSEPLSKDASEDSNTPRRDSGINIEVLAPAQSYIWDYHTTFYANNLGKTAAVSRVVWNIGIGQSFDANYSYNADNYVIDGKNEGAAYNKIGGVNWHTPALGTFSTMASSTNNGALFQFVYDGQNHNNNISVTITVNGATKTIAANASTKMVDAGVYVVGSLNLGGDTTYEGSSGYTFNTDNRTGRSSNITTPQLLVVIYPRVLKLVGGVAKEYDGTTVYEHVLEDKTDEEGNVTRDEFVNSADKTVAGGETALDPFDGVLTADRTGITVSGDFDDPAANENRSIGFEAQSKRKAIAYQAEIKNATVTLILTLKRDQDRQPALDENGYPELDRIVYSLGNGNEFLDTADPIPFNEAGEVAAFYGAVGQIDSIEEVRAAFRAAKPDDADDQIETAILNAYKKFVSTATAVDTVEVYNFQARIAGMNAGALDETNKTGEYYAHKTDKTVITLEAYERLGDKTNYVYLADYVYIAAEVYGERGFNYALVADGVKVPVTKGTLVAPTATVGTYNQAALGNEYVKITSRKLDVWYNGLFQSFYNAEVYDITGKVDYGITLADGATDEEKTAAITALREKFSLPSIMTDEQVLAFYDELKALQVTITKPADFTAQVTAAKASETVTRIELETSIATDNFDLKREDLTNGSISQVKNTPEVYFTVCHFDGKSTTEGLPYVGEGEDAGYCQFLKLEDRRGVLNLAKGSYSYATYDIYVEKDIDMEGATIRGIERSDVAKVTFDGGNHAITNLTVAQNAQGGQANGITIGFLTRVSEGSVVKNLILADMGVIVYGQSKFENNLTTTRVGGVAGYNAGTISNVVFEGVIKRYAETVNAGIGGAIGNGILGGIVGSNAATGVIDRAFALVSIETEAASADVRVGGMAGLNYGTISNSYAVGKGGIVHGDNCTVGSLVAVSTGTVTDLENNEITLNGKQINVLDMSDDDVNNRAPYSATTAALEFAGRTVEEIVRAYSLTEKLYGVQTDMSAPYGTEANPVKIHNFRQLEMALNMCFYYYEIEEDIVFNTNFDPNSLDSVITSGYGYGRIKIKAGKKITFGYTGTDEISIAANAAGTDLELSDAFKAIGNVASPFGNKLYEMRASFFGAKP